MNDECKVINIKTRRKEVIFRGTVRDDVKQVVLRSGITDPDKIDDTVEQIEQVICTSVVSAARSLAERLAEKAFKAFTQNKNTP